MSGRSLLGAFASLLSMWVTSCMWQDAMGIVTSLFRDFSTPPLTLSAVTVSHVLLQIMSPDCDGANGCQLDGFWDHLGVEVLGMSLRSF